MNSLSCFHLYAAGPLTQWELVFYGTETPPQDYDASPETNSVGTSAGLAEAGARAQTGAGAGAVVNTGTGKGTWGDSSVPDSEEVRQNAIDDDLALVWHDSHAVREI